MDHFAGLDVSIKENQRLHLWMMWARSFGKFAAGALGGEELTLEGEIGG
jgi:hypothetical protein